MGFFGVLEGAVRIVFQQGNFDGIAVDVVGAFYPYEFGGFGGEVFVEGCYPIVYMLINLILFGGLGFEVEYANEVGFVVDVWISGFGIVFEIVEGFVVIFYCNFVIA